MRMICAAILAVCLAACGGQEAGPSGADGSTNKVTTPAAGKYDSDAFITKYNGYVRYGVNANVQFYESLERYYRLLEDETPEARSTILPSRSTELELEKFAQTIEMDPSYGEMDIAARDRLAALKQVDTQIEQLDIYFSRQSHLEDDFSEGAEMREQLEAALETYYEANRRFDAEFNALEDALYLHDVEQFRKQGMMINAYLMEGMHEALKVSKIASTLDVEAPEAFDMAGYTAQLAVFTEIVDKVRKEGVDSQEVENRFGITGPVTFQSWLSKADKFIGDAKSVQAKIEARDFERSVVHNSVPDAGSPERLLDSYNVLNSRYNALVQ